MKYLILICLLITACQKKNEPTEFRPFVYTPQCTQPDIFAPLNVFEMTAQGTFSSSSELLNCLPAPDTIQSEFKLYEVSLTNVQMGDLLSAYFSAEVTNDGPVPLMIAWYMRLSQYGVKIYETNKHGTNVTSDMHHFVPSQYMNYKITGSGDYKLAVYVYAASGSLNAVNEYLKVENGYGRIEGVVWR